MSTVYTVDLGFDKLAISADLSQASAPISYQGPDGEWESTPLTADLAAIALRRLARSLAHPAAVTPSGVRTVAEDRREAVAALDRLAETFRASGRPDPADVAIDRCIAPPPARMQAHAIRRELPSGSDPDRLRRWADAWDAYAESA